MRDDRILTDEELAEIEARFTKAEQWQWQINSCGLSLEDVPRLIAALRASQDEVERLTAKIIAFT